MRGTMGAKRRLLVGVAAGIVCLLAARPVVGACWSEHPGAQEAFRNGFENYVESEWDDAISQFERAAELRSEPDGNCTVQLYGRGRDKKAYYLPYYLLGVSAYEYLTRSADEEAACRAAVGHLTVSLEWRNSTFDIYRARFRREWSTLREILETCDAPTEEGAAAAWNELRALVLSAP